LRLKRLWKECCAFAPQRQQGARKKVAGHRSVGPMEEESLAVRILGGQSHRQAAQILEALAQAPKHPG
jgi:hypothetical protein